MLAVQPVSDGSGDEELAAVGVLAGVSHGQQVRLVVLQLEVLISELAAVDLPSIVPLAQHGREAERKTVHTEWPPVPLERSKSPPWHMKLGMIR